MYPTKGKNCPLEQFSSRVSQNYQIRLPDKLLSLLFEFSVSYRKIPDFTSIGFILCVSAHFLCSFAGGTIVVVVILK